MKTHEPSDKEVPKIGGQVAPKPSPSKAKLNAMKARRQPSRSDDGNAFIPDPEGGPARTSDDLAENLAEGFLLGATQDEDADDDEALEGFVPEEIGGPFVETSAAAEFAEGTDGSNPAGAEREPLPRSGPGLVLDPESDEDEEEDKTR
jgi:hypothetical protein